jgi:hypothetical protein
MMEKDVNVAVDEAVDYRFGTPWDFGLSLGKLRRVTACMRARIRAVEVPFGVSPQLS